MVPSIRWRSSLTAYGEPNGRALSAYQLSSDELKDIIEKLDEVCRQAQEL
jgi:hypothetical protein